MWHREMECPFCEEVWGTNGEQSECLKCQRYFRWNTLAFTLLHRTQKHKKHQTVTNKTPNCYPLHRYQWKKKQGSLVAITMYESSTQLRSMKLNYIKLMRKMTDCCSLCGAFARIFYNTLKELKKSLISPISLYWNPFMNTISSLLWKKKIIDVFPWPHIWSSNSVSLRSSSIGLKGLPYERALNDA